MRCWDCDGDNGTHAKGCPEVQPNKKTAKALFNLGYYNGRYAHGGKFLTPPAGHNPEIYALGVCKGDCAKDAAENDIDPRFL